jgi:hypothetical protein
VLISCFNALEASVAFILLMHTDLASMLRDVIAIELADFFNSHQVI